MSLAKLMLAGFGALILLLVVNQQRLAERSQPASPHPPTPARVAFEAQQREAEARAAAVRRQAEAAAAVTAANVEEETVLAEGPGRSETFGYCVACHNTAVIRRSAFTRERWDELMDWMAEKHGMNPLEGELRQTIVDYLATQYGPRQRGPRGGNPFLN
jgi:mono/diheme cytochrome c family protein